jgi:hypothetical protein
VRAVGELDLLAPTVINHGAVSSTAGDVDIAVPSIYASAATIAYGAVPAGLSRNIDINNTSGSIQAPSGAINIGGTGLGKSAVLSLTGGNLDARAINLEAGEGALEADVNDVTGTVNTSGGSAHFASDANVLDLGSLNVAGDPTIFNAGDIQITAGFPVTEGLAIIASGNITAKSAVTIAAGGQNVYMVAGAKPPSGKPTGKGLAIPPLPSGQSITVSGGSDSGGFISLGNSTINAGSVTLVAYHGDDVASGRISNVNITTRGSGAGVNGDVTLIAGGIGSSTEAAISGISINASNGAGPPPAKVGLFAAQAVGGVSFQANGLATGEFSPNPNLTTGNIVLGPGTGIITDGGDISIKARSIVVNEPLMAVGSNGADGKNATQAGQAGTNGENGGNGGMITLEATDPKGNGITINAKIEADGGNGGNGGNGANAQVGIGGAGGNGGDGGMAGAIMLTTTDAPITLAAGASISAKGGSGGSGGAGAKGGDASALGDPPAGIGGRGGSGGLATGGGRLEAISGTGAISFDGMVNTSGGSGGGGGAGGNGGNDPQATFDSGGGLGGITGASQSGAMGGTIKLTTSSGAISLASVTANGGNGGKSAASGNGGSGARGGTGGRVVSSGDGAKGGS